MIYVVILLFINLVVSGVIAYYLYYMNKQLLDLVYTQTDLSMDNAEIIRLTKELSESMDLLEKATSRGLNNYLGNLLEYRDSLNKVTSKLERKGL